MTWGKRKIEEKGERSKKKAKVNKSSEDKVEGEVTKCCKRQFDDAFQCPCEVSIPDRIMLTCSICKGRDHGWCYGIFSMKAVFVHICGRCAIQNNTVCTSEEIKLWFLTDFKSEADQVEFKKELIKKRAVFSYAENEFAGYSGCYPPYGKYIEGRFSQGRKRAEDIVGSIMKEGFIAQMNTPFKVNLQQIKETYGYVHIYSNPQGDKERTKQGATAIL